VYRPIAVDSNLGHHIQHILWNVKSLRKLCNLLDRVSSLQIGAMLENVCLQEFQFASGVFHQHLLELRAIDN